MSIPPIVIDGIWGFLGALAAASGVLATCLWAGEIEPSPRQKRLCVAQFLAALVVGTTAAAAFTVTTHGFIGWAELRALSFIIGGLGNEGWGLIKRHVLRRITGVIDRKGP